MPPLGFIALTFCNVSCLWIESVSNTTIWDIVDNRMYEMKCYNIYGVSIIFQAWAGYFDILSPGSLLSPQQRLSFSQILDIKAEVTWF